ncbi:hypothetical protein [Mycobacteroides abscessus]
MAPRDLRFDALALLYADQVPALPLVLIEALQCWRLTSEARSMNRPSSDVQAFEVDAAEADLDDLRARLAAARLPDYNWRSFEACLNQIGQFHTVVDGLGIHLADHPPESANRRRAYAGNSRCCPTVVRNGDPCGRSASRCDLNSDEACDRRSVNVQAAFLVEIT